MIIEIQTFSHDGEQILGNLDGQALFACKNYKRKNAYKLLKTGNFRSKVSHWCVFRKPSTYSTDFTLLETIEHGSK